MFFPKETTLLQKALFIGSSLASLVLLISFMHTYAVDVLMADRINTWDSLFNEDNIWQGFIEQHGPHRVGFLFLFSKIGYILGHGYDTRFDLYVNAAIVWLMVPLGFWVKYRISDTFNWYDILIPFIITATWQWATLILNPHIHVMLPLFTLLFAALSLSKFRDNLILNCLLVFTATFSVYAIFAAVIYIGFKTLTWIFQKKWLQLTLLLITSAATFALYFYDFRWAALGSAGHFKFIGALKAPVLILSNFFYLPNWVGLLLILSLILLGYKYFQDIDLKNTKKQTTLFILLNAFSFVFFQSLGRSGSDPAAFSAFRYYTELALFIWVIAILASHLKPNKLVSISIFIGFTWVLFQPNNPKRDDWVEYTQNLEQLKACVLKTEDFQECNRNLKLKVHANPEKSNVVEKWILLDQRKRAYFKAK